LVPAVASAGEEDVARARAHYDIGLGLYNLGDYQGAIKEFSAGYTLSPRPEFFINLGQAHRKLRQLDPARTMFRRYLDESAPDAPNRAEVTALLAEVEAEQRRTPATPSSVVVQSAPPPAPAARRSALRRYWWTIPLSALLVSAAVGVGVYFAVRPTPQLACASATIGCFDLRY
jgi:tetratricopeptide (TPR) repeat protein